MQKEDLLEILEKHLFSQSNLDEKKLSEQIQISQKEIKEYFSLKSEEMGFIKDGLISHNFLRQYNSWTLDFTNMVYYFTEWAALIEFENRRMVFPPPAVF